MPRPQRVQAVRRGTKVDVGQYGPAAKLGKRNREWGLVGWLVVAVALARLGQSRGPNSVQVRIGWLATLTELHVTPRRATPRQLGSLSLFLSVQWG